MNEIKEIKLNILLIMMCVICMGSVVCAEEDAATDNDATWITCGYYKNSDDINVYKYQYATDVGLYILYNGSTYNVMAIADGSGSCNKEYSNSSGVYYQDSSSIKFNAHSVIASTSSIDDTDLPIFDDRDENHQDNLNAYIENGSVDGALNYYDVVPEPGIDSSIEKPKNMRTYGSATKLVNDKLTPNYNGQVTVRWDVSADNLSGYSYDVQVRCRYYENMTVEHKSSWKSFVTDYPYDTGGTIDLYTGEEVARTSTSEDFALTRELLRSCVKWQDNYYMYGYEVRVRNRKDNKCSDWVVITYNSNGEYTNEHNATVQDDDGNVIEDDYYNNQDVDNSDQDTYYENDPGTHDDGSIDVGNVSIGGIYDYIKGGFGLLGNNGVIALMARTFVYLPNSIWTIIKFFVSMVVVISLIKAVKEVLF